MIENHWKNLSRDNFKRIKLKEHTAEEERLGKRCSSLDQGGSMYRCKWSGSGSTLRELIRVC